MATIKLRQKASPVSSGATNKAAPLTLAEMDDNLDNINAQVNKSIDGTVNLGTQNYVAKYGATGLATGSVYDSGTQVVVLPTTASTAATSAKFEIGNVTASTITASFTSFQGDSKYHLYAVNGNVTTNTDGSEVARLGIGYDNNVTAKFSSGFSFIRGPVVTPTETNVNGALAIITSGTERVRIKSDGTVGIGTNDPGYLLHAKAASGSPTITVEAGDQYNAGFRMKNTAGEYTLTLHGDGAGAFLMYDNLNSQSAYTYKKVDGHKWYSSNTVYKILDKDGNLGLGTAPSCKLHVYSSGAQNVQFTQASGATRLLMGNQDSNGANKPSIIAAANGSLTFGYGTSWASGSPDGGTLTEVLRVAGNGNVGVGLTLGGADPTYKLQVAGSFAATSKSFVIDHPTKPGKQLRYGSLEGPENGVYVRGKLNGGSTIELPEYWTKLVDPDSITVNLTPIGKHQKLYVQDVRDNKVYVANDGLFAGDINCFYTVYGERVDVEKIVVEF